MHASSRIARETEAHKLKWKSFIEKVKNAAEKAKELYDPMSPLIDHLESQM